jgi:hypothetical protein
LRRRAGAAIIGGMTKYQERVRELIAHADRYHEAFDRADTFGGPSLYFHQRALETRRPPAKLLHLEYVYATLASWGMHRMGNRGSKMQTFAIFRQSVEGLKDKITTAQGFAPETMSLDRWVLLKDIFQGLSVMASGTRLVGNSKVMHHMMPAIVPPIDREYTLRYLRGNTNITNDAEKEWEMMQRIIAEFFIPVACDAEFASKARRWMADGGAHPWDTSVMKVVDNLIIGSRK